MRVLLDSSFILSSVQLGVDAMRMLEDSLCGKLEPFLLSETLGELKTISARRGKKGREAQLALKIVERYPVFSDTERATTVDEAIVKAAAQLGCIVATNDMRLKRKLRASGVAVAFLHRNKRMEVEGWAGPREKSASVTR